MIPAFYCDVDGVLNIRSRHIPTNSLFRQRVVRRVPFVGVPVRLFLTVNLEVVESLTQLPVDWFWLTSWNHTVQNLEEALKVTSAGIIPFWLKVKDVGREQGKYRLLKKHQTVNPSPFIWVDDVATKNYDPDDWVNHPYPHLVIQPSPKTGLTLEQVEQIKFFLSHAE